MGAEELEEKIDDLSISSSVFGEKKKKKKKKKAKEVVDDVDDDAGEGEGGEAAGGDEPAEGSAGGHTPRGMTGGESGTGGSPVRTPQQLLEAFKAADADGDGCLNSAELQGVLFQLGLEADGEGWGRSGEPLVFSECKKIVLELSQARDGE